MASEQELNLKFRVDDQGSFVLDKIGKSIQTVDKNTQSMNTSLRLIKWDSIVNLGERAFRAAEQVYTFAKSIASAANDIERNSRTLNMSIEDYQRWSYAAKMADVQVEDLMNSIKFLTRSIGEAQKGIGEAAAVFATLGIRIKDTSGHTKDQKTILLETIAALGKFADGTNRDILAQQIFGRSFMQIKPLINEGTEAIKKHMEEAEKMGTVLGDVVVKKGSEAEKQFKQMETQINATKISLAPLALEFAKAMASIIDDLRKFFTMEPPTWVKVLWGLTPMNLPTTVSNLWGKLGEKIGITESYNPAASSASFWASSYGEHKPMPGPAKPEAPILRSGPWIFYGMTEDQYNAAKAQIEANIEYQTDWLKVQPDLATYETIIKDLEKMASENELLYEYGKAINKTWQEGEDYLPLDKLREMNIELGKMDAAASEWASMGGYEMFGYESMEAVPGTLKKMEEEIKKSDKFIETFAGGLSSAWSTNLTNMLKGTETFAEGIKNIFTSMGDAIINVITKMINNWLIFGSITGEKGGTSFFGTSKGGYGGLIGGLMSLFSLKEGGYLPGSFIPLKAFQGGGYVNRPTLGMVGEGGEGEYIIPESKMSMGRTVVYVTNNYNKIDAVDAPSFFNIVKRFPGATLSVIEEDAKGPGTMRSVVSKLR